MIVSPRTHKALTLLAQRPHTTTELRRRLQASKATATMICHRAFVRGYLAKTRMAMPSGQSAVAYYMPDPARLAELVVGSPIDLARQAKNARQAQGLGKTDAVPLEWAEKRPFVARTVRVYDVELETVPIPPSRYEGASSLVGSARWGVLSRSPRVGR